MLPSAEAPRVRLPKRPAAGVLAAPGAVLNDCSKGQKLKLMLYKGATGWICSQAEDLRVLYECKLHRNAASDLVVMLLLSVVEKGFLPVFG